MEIKELRLGNLVVERGGEIVTVDAILGNGIGIETGYYGDYSCEYSKDYISPIPLTDVWLSKFGFKLIGGIWVKEYFECYFNNGKPVVQLEFDSTVSGGYTKSTDVIYVHQLQNLYYALTGEELTAKL